MLACLWFRYLFSLFCFEVRENLLDLKVLAGFSLSGTLVHAAIRVHGHQGAVNALYFARDCTPCFIKATIS